MSMSILKRTKLRQLVMSKSTPLPDSKILELETPLVALEYLSTLSRVGFRMNQAANYD
jgi:hypothetical protein